MTINGYIHHQLTVNSDDGAFTDAAEPVILKMKIVYCQGLSHWYWYGVV